MIIVWHSFLMGFASMCFRMRRGPANGWLRAPHFCWWRIYFAYIHALLIPQPCLPPCSLLPPPSSAASSLHLHAFIHSTGRRWAKAIEGETLLSGVWPSNGIGRRFWREGEQVSADLCQVEPMMTSNTKSGKTLQNFSQRTVKNQTLHSAEIGFQTSLLKYDLFYI